MSTTSTALRKGSDLKIVIGYDRDGKPIYQAIGFAPDDEDDDDDDGDVDLGSDVSDDDEDDDAATEDDDDEDEDEDDKPEPKAKSSKTTKDDKAKRDPGTKGPNYDVTLRREREARKAAQRQLNELRRKHETDQERLEREAEEKAAKRYKPVAIKAAARSALVEAKVKGGVTRALRLINLDDVDVDEDGDVIGLESQIDILKSEFPELFGEEVEDDEEEDEKPRRKPGRADTAPKNRSKSTTPKSSAEKLAAQAMAGRSRL